jgi:hypothetical protein
MQIREYQESDLAALRAIHAAQGFDYALPDMRNPLFVTKLVLADADVSVVGAQHAAPLQQPSSAQENLVEGCPRDAATKTSAQRNENRPDEDRGATKILGAAFLRLTAEAYLLLDPLAGTPRERWQWLLALHAAAERDAWQRGLEDVHAWLPPPIARKFGKRLQRLGWLRDDTWSPYCKRLEEAK